MYNPARLLGHVEEQCFVQAYENVREKYKGTAASNFCYGPHVRVLCMCASVYVCERVHSVEMIWPIAVW